MLSSQPSGENKSKGNFQPLYDGIFYDKETKEALTAAQAVVPHLFNIIKPSSVIDVGCGTGGWLSVLKQFGVERIMGLDGDYVDRSRLLIPEKCFRATDLAKPFPLNEKFDLAVSLEVAEHIAPKQAQNFIESLCLLAPVVLFSAAIPGQGGTHHVNEQWPEYWRQLFASQNYKMFDSIRGLIWQNERVVYYYRQNIFLFIHSDLVKLNEAFQQLTEVPDASNLNNLMLVSAPILYLHMNPGLGATLKRLPGLFRAALHRRLDTLRG